MTRWQYSLRLRVFLLALVLGALTLSGVLDAHAGGHLDSAGIKFRGPSVVHEEIIRGSCWIAEHEPTDGCGVTGIKILKDLIANSVIGIQSSHSRSRLLFEDQFCRVAVEDPGNSVRSATIPEFFQTHSNQALTRSIRLR